jgi:hypothetical protein
MREIFARHPPAAEVKIIVDAILERLRPREPFGVTLGQAAHPFRSHPHVGDYIGEHIIDRALDDHVIVVLRDSDQLLEGVTGKARLIAWRGAIRRVHARVRRTNQIFADFPPLASRQM